jgi:hypothetical protein
MSINQTADEAAKNDVLSQPVGGGVGGGEGTAEGDPCPCYRDMACEQDCCVQALRVVHAERLERIGNSAGPLRKQMDGLSISSYGSIDSLNGHMLTSPVLSGMDEDREPLLNSERELVSMLECYS